MTKFENTDVDGWGAAIRGMRSIKAIGNLLIKGAKIVVPIAGAIFLSKYENKLLYTETYGGEATYSDAVRVINSSDMFSSDKAKVVSELHMDKDSEFYKSVISIARSTMFSSDKVKTILNVNNN